MKILSKEVREDEKKGYLKRVHGVPSFIINGSEIINKTVSKEEMKEVLLNVINNSDKSKKIILKVFYVMKMDVI